MIHSCAETKKAMVIHRFYITYKFLLKLFGIFQELGQSNIR
jgi:hypothetical protein